MKFQHVAAVSTYTEKVKVHTHGLCVTCCGLLFYFCCLQPLIQTFLLSPAINTNIYLQGNQEHTEYYMHRLASHVSKQHSILLHTHEME